MSGVPPTDRVPCDEQAAGSPYRAMEHAPAVRTIAAGRRAWELDLALAVLLAVTSLVAMARHTELAMFLGFWCLWLGPIVLRHHLAARGVHRIDADARGLRLRCNEAALAQLLSVADPRAVDLYIEWDECISIDARPHQFGDDVELALVITTRTGVVAVRPGVFKSSPELIALRLHEARTELALPS